MTAGILSGSRTGRAVALGLLLSLAGGASWAQTTIQVIPLFYRWERTPQTGVPHDRKMEWSALVVERAAAAPNDVLAYFRCGVMAIVTSNASGHLSPLRVHAACGRFHPPVRQPPDGVVGAVPPPTYASEPVGWSFWTHNNAAREVGLCFEPGVITGSWGGAGACGEAALPPL